MDIRMVLLGLAVATLATKAIYHKSQNDQKRYQARQIKARADAQLEQALVHHQTLQAHVKAANDVLTDLKQQIVSDLLQHLYTQVKTYHSQSDYFTQEEWATLESMLQPPTETQET